MFIRQTIKEIVVLVGVAVILALVVNTFSPRGIALVGQWDTSKGVISADPLDSADQKLKEIDSVTHAKAIFDKGDVIFVDARSQDDYEKAHIPGAISLPLGQFDDRIGSFLDRYPPDQPIITYCSGRTCEDSHNLAQHFAELGFTNVRIFIDGFPGWAAKGYPIE